MEKKNETHTFFGSQSINRVIQQDTKHSVKITTNSHPNTISEPETTNGNEQKLIK